MPNYSANDPKGWCGDPKRGAALGRPTVKDASPDFSGKVHLAKIRMNGDYDCNGTYFGFCSQGEALFWVSTDDNAIDYVIRVRGSSAANRREAAKAKVRESYPKARFYR
jgi:hypothetical protein